MTVRRSLDALRRDPAFLGHASGLLALDRDFVIRAVNRALLDATGRVEEQVLSLPLFDAFPGNPEDEEDDGKSAVAASLMRVVRHGRPQHLVVQRYDVEAPGSTGKYVEKYWVPVHAPLRSGDDVVGVMCRADEVSEPRARALAVIERYKAALAELSPEDLPPPAVADALVFGVRQLDALEREAEQLKEALVSRATIDQAKGIVMARDAVGPDEAFAVLVKMSNESNVRLAEVAKALVYRAQRT